MPSYHYYPSSAAAIVALVLFSCTTALHTFQLVRTRTWYFIPFAIGGVAECVGYICRTVNTYKTPNWVKQASTAEQITILIAPAFLAASMYMLFGRLIRLTDGDSRSFIKQRFLTGIFVAGDVLSLLVQAAGGGLYSSTNPDSARTGQKIIEAGIFIQIFAFSTFIICGLVFHYRIVKRPTIASLSSSNPWQKHMYALYIGSCLIFGRCIFRVSMFIQGSDGSISSSEVALYICESLFVFTVMALFNVVNPGEVSALLRAEDSNAWGGNLKRLDTGPQGSFAIASEERV